jgi:hypothetical protein
VPGAQLAGNAVQHLCLFQGRYPAPILKGLPGGGDGQTGIFAGAARDVVENLFRGRVDYQDSLASRLVPPTADPLMLHWLSPAVTTFWMLADN